MHAHALPCLRIPRPALHCTALPCASTRPPARSLARTASFRLLGAAPLTLRSAQLFSLVSAHAAPPIHLRGWSGRAGPGWWCAQGRAGQGRAGQGRARKETRWRGGGHGGNGAEGRRSLHVAYLVAGGQAGGHGRGASERASEGWMDGWHKQHGGEAKGSSSRSSSSYLPMQSSSQSQKNKLSS
ncbi:hypothetical protein BS50DRAFT_573597 [Corynespora cassiicola Philippines]|uniref:Uncharacterized protein n=1 Tax=Corynespora cassiicola Philippines TaxID=1448308 RepID=A0A2T2NN39_CORCC|nr:hypothetical protein BS50DRAFT_573597 [Corynespora cassiicola Philippines]